MGGRAGATPLPCASRPVAHLVTASRVPRHCGRCRARRRQRSARAAQRVLAACRGSLGRPRTASVRRPAVESYGCGPEARATRKCRTEAMSPASVNPRAAPGGNKMSRLWWLASARRSSAVRAPNASDSIAASACSSVRPESRIRVTQRSCWAAAAMVSYSAARWATEPHYSCSAVAMMVSCADNSAPTCWSTPNSAGRPAA